MVHRVALLWLCVLIAPSAVVVSGCGGGGGSSAAATVTGKVLDDATILTIAAECGRTPAQVSLRWLVQKGCVVIPASGSAEHLRENMGIFDWQLTPAQEARIDRINQWVRIYCGRNWELRQERTRR